MSNLNPLELMLERVIAERDDAVRELSDLRTVLSRTHPITIEEADRPETRENEDAYFLKAYREALERIGQALNLLGSPDLLTDVPKAVENLVTSEKSYRGKSHSYVSFCVKSSIREARSECATIVRRYLTTRADGDNGYLIADGDDDAMLAEIEGRLPEEGEDHGIMRCISYDGDVIPRQVTPGDVVCFEPGQKFVLLPVVSLRDVK